MADVDINDLASVGAIVDEPAHQLPPEAWSLSHNIRFSDNGAQRLPGYEVVFDVGSYIAPHFSLPVSTAAQTF